MYDVLRLVQLTFMLSICIYMCNSIDINIDGWHISTSSEKWSQHIPIRALQSCTGYWLLIVWIAVEFPPIPFFFFHLLSHIQLINNNWIMWVWFWVKSVQFPLKWGCLHFLLELERILHPWYCRKRKTHSGSTMWPATYSVYAKFEN